MERKSQPAEDRRLKQKGGEKQPQRGLSPLFLPPPHTKVTATREPACTRAEGVVLSLGVESGHPVPPSLWDLLQVLSFPPPLLPNRVS